MSRESTRGADPSIGPRARYFAKEGEAVQVVHNLRDATAYRELGYEETDEEAYRAYQANLSDAPDGPCPDHADDLGHIPDHTDDCDHVPD
ncbi:hypothetical protein [Streptomyces sp. WG7]|uniref:hypothetical protein n=1 Tax=Streptomyces sp. WG7 TaxID=3417650 RepID=UPI003CF5DB61